MNDEGDFAGVPVEQAVVQQREELLQRACRVVVVERVGHGRNCSLSFDEPVGLFWRVNGEGGRKQIISDGGTGNEKCVENRQNQILR